MLRQLIRRTRRNHALEHATLATLVRDGGTKGPLAGMSTPWGFYVLGKTGTEPLLRAATAAARRMRAGERELAVSPFCGTNMLVGAALTTAATALVLRRRRAGGLPSALSAATIALCVTPFVGAWVQRHVTTLADLGDTEVSEVRPQWPFQRALHLVRTGPSPPG